ncbi:hypothetical protein [Tateyamaria sp. SN3-11]|uniref:hypothetical protein n=1 Tax=Tateyamaria sp. SN3-11 TaxID=3092147 RepID=UPI0039E7BC12
MISQSYDIVMKLCAGVQAHLGGTDDCKGGKVIASHTVFSRQKLGDLTPSFAMDKWPLFSLPSDVRSHSIEVGVALRARSIERMIAMALRAAIGSCAALEANG